MTKSEAQSIYRTAWMNYCLDPSPYLEEVMDSVQGNIGSEWEDFINTLPGFREFWASWEKDINHD